MRLSFQGCKVYSRLRFLSFLFFFTLSYFKIIANGHMDILDGKFF